MALLKMCQPNLTFSLSLSFRLLINAKTILFQHATFMLQQTTLDTQTTKS